MKSFIALGLVACLALLSAPLPTAAASCNVYYNAATRDCVGTDTGTTSQPAICNPAPCGSPCVLNRCLTREDVSGTCVEFSFFRGLVFGEECVPVVI